MIGIFVLCVVGFGVFALTAPPSFPASGDLETTSKRLEETLRCPVCEGQSVAESNSAVALEIRADIRQRLASGQPPSVILDDYVAQYGAWILNRPPYGGTFTLLWIAPFAALGVGAAIAVQYVQRGRRRHGRPEDPQHLERPSSRRDGDPSPTDKPPLRSDELERLDRELKNRL